jgi:hypothetical protein
LAKWKSGKMEVVKGKSGKACQTFDANVSIELTLILVNL